MRDALLAASRELDDAVDTCVACKTPNKEAFPYCTKTPDFYDGACPECILAGIPCKRPGI